MASEMSENLRQSGQTFPSALGATRYTAILPEGYDDPSRSRRRYPVIYLLHGIGGHEDEWLQGSRIGEYVVGRDLILVGADAAQRCYLDSHDGTSACETMAARDLVAFVDTTYRTSLRKEARGLMGLSMGGYGALYLSLRHSTTFQAAASLSGAFHHYLLAFGIAHQYDEYPGGHAWPFWDAHAAECLDFLANYLVDAS